MTTIRVVPAKLVSSLCLIVTAAVVLACTESNGPDITPPDDPLISLSSTSTSFAGIQAGAAPQPQTITINNGGDGTLSGLTATVSYSSGQPGGWLDASLSATTAPSTLTLTATPGSLPAGAYSASVAIGSSGTSNSPQTLSVSFTVAPQPAAAPLIALSSTSQSFTALQGGAAPPAQTISITNAGDGTLSGLSATVSYGAGTAGWLGVSLSGTTAPSTLTLTANLAGLAAGAYAATVTVASEAAGNTPQTVAVSLTIAPPSAGPLIALSSTSRRFEARQGGSNPARQTVSITNGGGGTLRTLAAEVSYTAGQPNGWLAAQLNRSAAPATLTLTATTGSLAAGTYTASIGVKSSGASNSPQAVSVTFTVAAPAPPAVPIIALSATSASFQATQGGANPDAKTFQVTNGGGGTLSGLQVEVSYAGSATTGWLQASLSQTSAPSTLTLTATVGALAPGIYPANVLVSSSIAGTDPKGVSVNLTVAAAAPKIGLSTSSVSFSGEEGQSTEAQEVTITNTGGGNLTGLEGRVLYAAGQPEGWLNADLSSTSTPSTLTLTATAEDLAAETYKATVEVTAASASNSPQVVNVTFTVARPSERSELFFASADNYLVSNSSNPNAANAVFSTGPLVLGSKYDYLLFALRERIHYASVLQFDVQSAIEGKEILEAKLRIFQDNVPQDPRGRFRLNAMASSWSPSTITWNKALTIPLYPVGQVNFAAGPSPAIPLELNVTTIVQKWADGSFQNHGLKLSEPNPVPPGADRDQTVMIQSMDLFRAEDKRPQLFIRYR